jgi:hypothetical protein
MTDSDRQLDDVLRGVPLPEQFRASLAPQALFADAALDRLLAAVVVPETLADRVRSAARSGDHRPRDGVVDLTRFTELGDDRLPATPTQAATTVPRRVVRVLGLAREAGRVAAAIGLAVGLAFAGIEASRQLEGPAAPAASVAADAASSGRAASSDWRPQPTSAATTDPQVAGRSLGQDGNGETPGQPLVADGAEDGMSPPWPGDPAGQAAVGQVPELAADFAPEVAIDIDPPAVPTRVRGAAILPAERHRLPTLTVVAAPGVTRRLVSKSAAFDVAFEMAHGESPFIDPAADQALAVDRPPLTLRTDGFEFLTKPDTGRRPRSLQERIRVEEVLAAMPAPESLRTTGSNGIRLGLFAVRSGRVLGGRPTLLFEAAAFAAGRPTSRSEPVAATLILDQAAAGDPRAWPRICRGLVAIAERLGPADRISVVLCGPRPRVALREADPAALAAAALNWEALPAAASSDLDASVEAARAAGLLDHRTVIVAHAITLDRGRGEIREMLASWRRGLALSDGEPLACAAAIDPRFVILDPATPAPDAGPTFGRTSPDAVAIRRELARQIIGADTLVARQCRLEVRFDPGRVAAYRLVGHRQSVVESLAGDEPAAIDLHVGETVRAVYEVVPRDPAGLGLATASVSWRAADGSVIQLDAADRDAADRQAALPSPHGCELLLAATLGELAAGSVHVVQPRGTLSALAAVADRWRARGDLTPFGDALAQEIDRRVPGTRAGRGR